MTGSRRLCVRFAAGAVAVGAALVSLGATPSPKVTVLSRVRTGGYAEELTYVANGPLAGHIVFVEGYEVWGIPVRAPGQAQARKLFDLYALDPVPRATGIAYVESRKQFVVNESVTRVPDLRYSFFFVDHQGQPKGGASLAFPTDDTYRPDYIEAIAYVPPTAVEFPDHLVMVAQNGSAQSSLLVVTLTGEVVKRIVPGCPFAGWGVEYLPGDRLVLSSDNQTLCVVDFEGVVSAGPIVVDTVGGIGEGVTRLADGRIVVAEWPQNLLFFDADFNRLPQADRHDVVGLGLNEAPGLAWDPGTHRHLLTYAEPGLPTRTLAIAAAPPKLAPATKIRDLTDGAGSPTQAFRNGGMTHLAQESLVAVAFQGRNQVESGFRGLRLWNSNTGDWAEQIDLCVPSEPPGPIVCTNQYGSPQSPAQWGRAVQVAYIPGPPDGRFAVLFAGAADAHTVYFFTRLGDQDGKIDLSLTSVNAFEYFDPGDGTGGRLLLIGRTASSPHQQVFIMNLAGEPLVSFDARAALGLPTFSEVSAITTGPQAGAFAALDVTAQGMVVFRLK